MLSFVNIIFNTTNISALSYQSEVGIGFTFNPTLSVSLSSNNLVISNLTPGSSSDSNSINVVVATNASYGYTLSVNTSSDNLTHSNNIDTFNSIATDADLASLTTDNTWGYSTSLDSGTTWGNYNGLSSPSSTTLLDKDNNISSNVDFKIAAKAGNTQPSGTYTNTITFTAVTKPTPMTLAEAYASEGKTMINGFYTMQDMTSTICNKVEAIGAQLQVLDIRDYKVYWIAKLADQKCWMTQNLDLDLSHEIALTSETSDIDPESYGTTIYTTETGYSKDETTGVVSWTPSNSADTAIGTWDGDVLTVSNFENSSTRPYSASVDNKYLYTNNLGNQTFYNSLEDCANSSNDSIGCQHSHVGNHYNYTASVASNDSTNIPDDRAAANSICPKGWSLPKINYLAYMLRAEDVFDVGNAYKEGGGIKIRTSPLYFVMAGQVSKGGNSFGVRGQYRINATASDTEAYSLVFNPSSIYPWGYVTIYKYYGASVRCVAN